MATDLEIAQEVLDRVLVLLNRHCAPLVKYDPINYPRPLGVREFQVGDFHFQVKCDVSHSDYQFGAIRCVAVQEGIPHTYYNTAGYVFFLNAEAKLKNADGHWLIRRDVCVERLLPCLRQNMVLDDLIGPPPTAHILSVTGA